MRTTSNLLLLLFITLFSCKEEDEPIKLKELRVSLLSKIGTFRPDEGQHIPFVYNQAGLLEEFGPMKYNYNDKKLLTSTVILGDTKEDYSYDATGKITTVYLSRMSSQEPPFREYRITYDGTGRISRVDFGFKGKLFDQFAILLTYDQSGNVTREEAFRSTASGELTSKFYLTEISYDTKKNPFKGLGSPVSKLYYFSYALQFNLAHFISPNNPVEVVTTFHRDVPNTTYSDTFGYKYNEQGLPLEITNKEHPVKLEYSLY